MKRTVAGYMSTHPHTIGARQSMSTAHKMMRENHIRHLPVLEGGHLLGIVTERDLHLVETLKDVNPELVLVEDAMTPDPYTVTPDSLVTEVVAQMIDHKYGCAIVMDKGHVVGLFTTIDALHAYRELSASTPARNAAGKNHA